MFFTSMIGTMLVLDMLFSILDNNSSRAITDLILVSIILLMVLIFKKLGKIGSDSKR